MAYMVSENFQLDATGTPHRSVVFGGHVYNCTEMDELIGALMKARNQLGATPPELDDETIKKAIGVIQEELAKHGMMKIAKEAAEARRANADK